MAPLPIFHGELKASLAAMMAFPNDLEKAELCACWLDYENRQAFSTVREIPK